MASAGLGNAVSDVLDTLGETAVADFVVYLVGSIENLKKSTGVIMTAGSTGIFSGCITGLSPLLFI